jgi:hypothetical protein
MSNLQSWAAAEGFAGRMATAPETPGIGILAVVVPAQSIRNLADVYANAQQNQLGHSAFRSSGDSVEGSASWMVNTRGRSAVARIQLTYPLLLDFDVIFDLVDTDWLRMLQHLYWQHKQGDVAVLILVPDQRALEEFESDCRSGNQTLAFNLGIAFETQNIETLSRLRKIEGEIQDDVGSRKAATGGNNPIAYHFRNTYPSIVDIVSQRGGAFGVLLGEFPALIIDLGYYDEDGLWGEAAIQELLSLGFTRPSRPEIIWPTANRFLALIMNHHISIIHSPELGQVTADLRVLISGIASIDREWRMKVIEQGGVPVLVANIGMLDEGVSKFPAIFDDLFTFQTAAIASIPVLDADFDVYQNLLPTEPEDELFNRRLSLEWSTMLLRRSISEQSASSAE